MTLTSKPLPCMGMAMRKNFSPLYSNMPANNEIYQRVLIISCLTFTYENSKCTSLTSRVYPGVGVTWHKTLDLHLPSCHTHEIHQRVLIIYSYKLKCKYLTFIWKFKVCVTLTSRSHPGVGMTRPGVNLRAITSIMNMNENHLKVLIIQLFILKCRFR